MSKLTLIILLMFCTALVILPLWGSSKGFGESTVTTKKDKKTGNIRYVGSRSWSGGGTSSGK
jgi:hypothetical protein